MNLPSIGAVVEYQYDWLLVALSFLIAALGSYVALYLALDDNDGGKKTFSPALALGGCGIWAMHFIGMTAYKTPLRVSYSLLPTLFSLVVVIAITMLGFRIALSGAGKIANLVMGGTVIGAGVVAMHYSGMLAMDIRASFDWHWPTIIASVVIAVVAATVALWLAFNVKTNNQRMQAATVMGVAVCAMHYTGMAAASLICVAQTPRNDYSIDGGYLPYFVFFLALVALGSSVLNRALSQPSRKAF